MTIRWPRAVLRPQDPSFDIAPRSLAAPSSVSGVGQVVSSDAGIWKATFGGVVIRNRQHVLAFRAIANLLEGRLGTILLPVCRGYQPVPDGSKLLYDQVPHSDGAFFDDDTGYVGRVIDVVTVGSMALRAVSGTVAVNYAGEIEPGQHFSVGERLYRLRSYKETVPATPAGTVTADAPFTGSSFSAVTPNVSRSSNATYFDASGVLQTAAANVLRLDHDPVTGEPKGALIEGAATNLLTYSEDLDNAAWFKTRCSITPNVAVAPDGTTTMDKIVESVDAGNHFVQRVVSVVAGTTYPYSFFVKAAELTAVSISFSTTNGAFAFGQADFDLVAGTVSVGTAEDATIVPVGDDVYRISATKTATATASGSINIILRKGGAQTYTGDGSSGLHVWGAQLEARAFPTSYIKTTTATATRAADVVSVPTSAFPFNEPEGTLLVEAAQVGGNFIPLANLDRGSKSAAPHIRLSIETSKTRLYVTPPIGANKSKTGATTLNMAAPVRFAASWSGSVIQACANGGTVDSLDVGEAFSTFALTRLLIGDGAWFTTPAAYIKRLVYFPRRLSDAEIQRMTSVPSIFSDPLTVDNLVMIANESTTISAQNNNDWLVRLSDGSELTYNYVEGPLSVPAEDLGYRLIESYRTTLAKPLPATAEITFRPPLREAVPAGTNLEFDDPVCRMRLATDDAMDLPLDLGRFAFPTVNFIEDL